MALHLSDAEYSAVLDRLGGSSPGATLPTPSLLPKFRNQKTTVDGITFASKGEAVRWQELRLQQHAGIISDLRRQVPYSIDIAGIHICKYVADFVYREAGQEIVEDYKGYHTPEYNLKRSLMLAVRAIKIREIGARKGKRQ